MGLIKSQRKLTPIHYKKLIRVFEKFGFMVSRRRGDHIAMTKEGCRRPLFIKSSPRKVPVAHIRTNLTTADISREAFFQAPDTL